MAFIPQDPLPNYCKNRNSFLDIFWLDCYSQRYSRLFLSSSHFELPFSTLRPQNWYKMVEYFNLPSEFDQNKLAKKIDYIDGSLFIQLVSYDSFAESGYCAVFENKAFSGDCSVSPSAFHTELLASFNVPGKKVQYGPNSSPYFFFSMKTALPEFPFTATLKDSESEASINIIPGIEKPGESSIAIDTTIVSSKLAAHSSSTIYLPYHARDFVGNGLKFSFEVDETTASQVTLGGDYSFDLKINFDFKDQQTVTLKDLKFVQGFSAGLDVEGKTLYWFECKYGQKLEHTCSLLKSVGLVGSENTLLKINLKGDRMMVAWVAGANTHYLHSYLDGAVSTFRFVTVVPQDVTVVPLPYDEYSTKKFFVAVAFNSEARSAVDLYLVEPSVAPNFTFYRTISGRNTKSGLLCPIKVANYNGKLTIVSSCLAENKLLVLREDSLTL